MIDSILGRGTSKYYHHAVRYLKRLVPLSKQIEGWQKAPEHKAYLAGIAREHKRKTAFWAQLGRTPESWL